MAAPTVGDIAEHEIAEVAGFLARQVPPGEAKSALSLPPGERLHWLSLKNPARREDIPFGWRVRDDTGAIVGAAICTPFRIHSGGVDLIALMFSKFYVDVPFRGMGLGLLMRFVRLGKRFPLFCTSTNAAAGALFARVGAAQIEGLDHTMLGIARMQPLAEEFLHRRIGHPAAARLLSAPAMLMPRRTGRSKQKSSGAGKLTPIETADNLAWLELAVHDQLTAVIRDSSYLRWRYFSDDGGKDVYRFAFSNEPDRLIVVNKLRSGYRGQIRVLNVLDVWPPASASSAPALSAALSLRYVGAFDAVWLRSQPIASEIALSEVGFVRHDFPAPLGWFIDSEKKLVAKRWYVMPGESEQEHSNMSRKPNMNSNLNAPRTDWGDVADWYDKLVGESGSEYHREVVHPGVTRLLGLKKGERAVDIACGQGVLCRLLTERGIEMTGVDAATELIRAARERGPKTIRYFAGDARDLKFLPTDSFDAAACVLAIQNIHPIQPVFAGVQRVLRPGGKFVLVMMHPCFRGPKETSWGWDEKTKEQYRRVDRYLLPRKTPIVTHPGKDPDAYTWSFHKPLEQFVRSLRNVGLLIDALEEWTSHKVSEPGPRAATENAARKEIPMFLALRGIKVNIALDRTAVGEEPPASA